MGNLPLSLSRRQSKEMSRGTGSPAVGAVAYGMTEFRHYLLLYDTAPDYLERRSSFRSQHLHLLREAGDRGELVLGGALANPVDGAVILFKGTSSEVAEKFARVDPYVIEGLVTSWRVREWTTVVGDGAASPVHP